MAASTIPMYMKVGRRATLTAGLAWASPKAIALSRTAAHSGTRVRSSRKSMPRKNTSSQMGAATAVTSSARSRRSSQRSRWAACGEEAGGPPSSELIIRRLRGSAGDAVINPIAVRQAEGCPDLEAQPRENDLGLQKIALNVGCGVPPQIVFRRGVAHDPDRNRTGHGIIGPALDQFPAIDVRQPEVDQDQGRHP